MSELTNWLDKMADECDRECRVSGSAVDLQKDQFKAQAHAIAARINWHLRAHDAEIRERAMLEQMEADCKAVCPRCRDTEMPAANFQPRAWWTTDHWGHGISGGCVAGKIRAAYAEAHPKVK